MLSFFLKRLLQAVPVLLIASIIIFAVIHMIPGDPALLIAGADATPEMIEAIQVKMGLNRPLIEQYFTWIGGFFSGDMGNAMVSGLPVSSFIKRAYPATIQLAVSSLLFSIIFGFLCGIFSAIHNKKFIDWFINLFVTASLALPNFWLGILLILVFSIRFKLLLPTGYEAFFNNPLLSMKFLILPTLSMSFRLTAEITRFVKNSILEIENSDFVRTAKAKGLSRFNITLKHVLRNALIPIITMIGLRFGRLLGGAVIVENVFSWPGLGRLLANSVITRDYPLIQSSLMIIVITYIGVSLITDFVYGIADPRISLDKVEG